MDLPKRNNGNKRFSYKIICLVLFLVIMMTKIVSYSCQDLTGSIRNNGISKKVFSISLDDLWPCRGKPNCYYQQNSKSCTKITQLSIRLSLTKATGLKPPPLVATLSAAMKNNKYGLFKDPYKTMDQNKPLQLVLCDERLDMLEWAKTSLIANTSLPPTLNMVFTIVYPDSKRVQKIKTAALEFSSIFIVNFNDPPECVLVDDFNHKVFWSDSNRGTIEAYDTKTNKMMVLAMFLDMPRSMVIDSTLGLLFFCNIEIIGRASIERVNFDGGNRVEITKGKYDVAYPDKLGIDPTKRMLYWTENQVIHTSDYNGNYHEIMLKSDSYDPNFPGCFSFAADAVEYNFFWENRQLQHFNRSFVPNHLVSISYHKDDKALKYKELPSMFREQKHFSPLNLRTMNVTCPKLIPKKHLCFLLPLPLRTISYLWDNRSVIKYKLVRQNNMRKYLEHHGQHKKITWYVNSKIRSSLFYDPRTNHIRFLIYVVQDMNQTIVYKYKFNYVVSYVLKKINVYTSNLIILDTNEKSFYLFFNTNNSTEIFNSDGTNGGRYLAPNVYSYVTQVMDYNNNAQSNKMTFQKFVLNAVFKIVFDSIM